jgi:hypothetical protein
MLESMIAAALHALQALSAHVVAFGPIFPQ